MNIDIEQPDTSPPPFRPDAHYQHLTRVIPHWLTQASRQKREALSKTRPHLPDAIKNASRSQHAELSTLNARHWTAQNRVDQSLARLQNASAFAAPLLQAAIKQRFNLNLDVSQTFLRLYIPAHLPWLRLKSGAARIWTLSLLDAALHNFESAETEADAFEPASTYITQPSSIGQFNALPQILQKMPIAAFSLLCRELDIGERYKKYLQDNLGISNPLAAAILQPKIRQSQHTALTAALHMAQMQNLLDSEVHRLILGLAGNLPLARLHGQPWRCHELTIMNARLTGIVLFAPDLQQAREGARVVAYIPDDPEHPIKQYASSAAFAEELSQRLRNPAYQQFFSRFIDHEDRGHFFAQLNSQLSPITWQPVQPGDSRPTWRETPNQRPNLQMAATPIEGDLWVHLYQRQLDKILNDARVIAVSTATVDRKARWALWDSFTEIASALLNIAAFIALPFVPFLGELMLAYIAYQLLDETFESIVDWAEGLTNEAFEHFMAMVESAVQLGTFAAGSVIVAGEFRAVLPQEVVQFIDRFNSVKRPNGESRYWKPDLTAYEHSVALPKDAKPDAMGLHQHQGKTLLKLDNKSYVVSENTLTGQQRIDHPSRPEAYKPALKHNGSGAWQSELDQPLRWDRSTLLRRIGPDMERFSTSERERILSVSGCHEDALRKMHVNAGQVPPLLADTLQRFKIDQDIQTFIQRIGSERADEYVQADPVMQLELLNENGYWPANRGLRLIGEKAQVLWQSPAPDVAVLQIDAAQLNDGDLLKTFLLALSEAEARAMLGNDISALHLETRTHALRLKLAELAERKRESLFQNRYRQLERGAPALTQTIIDAERGLPISYAQALLDTASEQELQQLRGGTLSKRLADMAHEAGLQLRATRAYEGLELTSTANNLDTDRLVLHSLKRLPGWSEQVRIEVRHYTHDGRLMDSIGPMDAPIRKVVVLTEEGLYQAFDETGETLNGAGTLYSCLLQALPDNERVALNIRIGEDATLKQQIRDHALGRNDLRSLLLQHRDLKPAYDPAVMRLLGGSDGYRHMPVNTPSLLAHAQRLLPQLSAQELEAFAEKLQRHPSGPRAELSRLFTERDQLDAILNPWIDEIPLFTPDTDQRLSAEQFAIQKQSRRQLRIELLDCWVKEVTHPDLSENMIEVRFSRPIVGELPQLNVDFNHVTTLIMDGDRGTRGAQEFLKHFSGLRRLVLRDLELGRLPDTLGQSPQLHELILSDCAVTLTPESMAALSALHHLQTLDLYKNPLGLLPSVESMPQLKYIDASETGISHLPTGLLTRPHLRTALLNGNQIQALPSALFELTGSVLEGFDLGDNPIGAADRERIKRRFVETRHDFGVMAEQTDLLRVQALYSHLDREEASEFIYLLPGTLAEGRVEIERLEVEFNTLSDNLATWTADVPDRHPVSGEPFTAQELENEHGARDALKNALEQCWQRETEQEYDQSLGPYFELNLTTIINGELPVLNARFNHVTHVYMRSLPGRTTGAARFLESFANLRSLTIYDYQLGNIPEAIFTMADLKYLALSDCQITLTEQSVLALAQLEHLDFLDLSGNPLGRTLDVSQMSDLSTLLLDNTGITELPHGLLKLTNLETVNLNDNAITHIPHDILELPLEIAEVINLKGNPLDEESVQLLITYFKKTVTDFGVEAVIEQAETEVSTSGDSDPDE